MAGCGSKRMNKHEMAPFDLLEYTGNCHPVCLDSLRLQSKPRQYRKNARRVDNYIKGNANKINKINQLLSKIANVQDIGSDAILTYK